MAPQPAILGTARLGNFRLAYETAAMKKVRAGRVRILLAGADARVRVAGLTIRDVLNDAPNGCTLKVDDQVVVLSSPYRAQVLADGPIHYWPLDASGGDVVGAATVAINGTVIFSQPGPLADGSTATLFDGSATSYIGLGPLSVPAICSYEAWIQTTNAASQSPILTGYNGGSGGPYFGKASTKLFAYMPFGGTAPMSSVAPINTGAWVHVVVTYDGTLTRMYVNGVLDNTLAQINQATTGGVSWFIAHSQGTPTEGWPGSLAHLALYPYALSPSQVAKHSSLRTTGPVPVLTTAPAPSPTQSLRVLLGSDAPTLLFNGALQTVDLSYEGRPNQLAYPCTAVDDTTQANRRRPFGNWVNVSATIFAQQVMALFASGFTTTHVQTGLPTVTILLDGTEGMSGALKQAATQIGGYFYFEDNDLHLFITEASAPPDPIDMTPGRFLNDPPIAITRDVSQLRTAQAGRAHGEPLLADVASAETILPVANAGAWFGLPGFGGGAIALAQRLTYSGVQAGIGGTLVGPGAAPSAAPSVVITSGAAGLGIGTYRYVYTNITAAGESLPSPPATIQSGVIAPPANAPTASGTGPGGATGGAMDPGSYDYGVIFITALGATTLSPISGSVTTGTGPIAPPGNQLTLKLRSDMSGLNGTYRYGYTFVSDAGESMLNPLAIITSTQGVQVGDTNFTNQAIEIGPPGTTRRKVYRTTANGTVLKFLVTVEGNASRASILDNAPDSALGTDAPTYGTVRLTGIALGGGYVTSRQLYRRLNGTGLFQSIANIPDNTTTTYTDVIPNSGLGSAAPTTNTAAAQQVLLLVVPIGPTGTTARKVYRTLANGAAYKLWGTVADNVNTNIGLDNVPDATIAGNAAPPVNDTSGLTQPPGQINAGATSILTASAAPFQTAGGWALLGGGQTVRYTGISGNNLIGIPASGIGAIVTTVLYGTSVVPAPALTGVSGVVDPILKGTIINLWIQRYDLDAITDQAAVDRANGIVPADGIYEGPPLVDERRNEASMRALCDATLQQNSRPIVTVTYSCRDIKTKSGKTVSFAIDSPYIHETLTIQEVTITEIDVAAGVLPRFSVVASSVRHSLDDIVRRLIAATDAT